MTRLIGQSGVTLIELIVSIVILSIAGTGILMLFAQLSLLVGSADDSINGQQLTNMYVGHCGQRGGIHLQIDR